MSWFVAFSVFWAMFIAVGAIVAFVGIRNLIRAWLGQLLKAKSNLLQW
jgi:hypothetical protein